MIGSLDVGAGDFAVEFEMRSNVRGPVIQCSQDGANYGAVIIDRDRLNQPRSYLVSLTESNIAFAIDGNVVRTICGATNVTDNNWHTVRAERSGSVMRLYVDGRLDASGDAPTSDIRCISESTPGDCDLVIGQEKWLMGYHYRGDLRNVRIYNGDELILELF